MKLQPHQCLSAYSELTAEHLKANGIKALLLDVDNTLAPYEQPEPDEALLLWLSAMEREGIRLAIVSNNKGDRIGLFTKALSIPVIANAKKPLPKAFKKAITILGVTPEETACIGDQIFTDILCGRLSRLKWTVLVPPIKDKRDLFTRTKRWLEQPILKKYWRQKNHD